MKRETKASLRLLFLEVILYAVLVTGYYFLVLQFLANGLADLYRHNRQYYAVLALGLIVGQGFLLEVLTRVLLTWIAPRTED